MTFPVLMKKASEFVFEENGKKHIVGLLIDGLSITALKIKIDFISSYELYDEQKEAFIKRAIKEAVLLSSQSMGISVSKLKGEYALEKREKLGSVYEESYVWVTPKGITPFSSLK